MTNICNACRYCEGFCATFPALERRLSFESADLEYLANLCHNCGACLYSCQYAPPHEFQLNYPRLLAELRKASYEKYAWPGPWMHYLAPAVGLLVTIAVVMQGPIVTTPHSDAEGAFYAVAPHWAMAGLFTILGVLIVAALVIGFARFWKSIGESPAALFNLKALSGAFRDAATLRNLDGGGEGCTYPDERFTPIRRNFHHFTFYGFLLCFASTTVAAIYSYVFQWEAPYDPLSLPVTLGVLGGIGLLIGTAGLFWLKLKRDPALGDPKQTAGDIAFILLLFAISLTGLLLLFLREDASMGWLLAIHLGLVAWLFAAMPYGKFVHALYRFGALIKYHLENDREAKESRA
jgi:citrate/tricarballylate utilization protein